MSKAMIVGFQESSVETRNFDLDKLNNRFEFAHPRGILEWCVENIPNGLVQTTAFSINGMVIIDILHRQLKLPKPIPVIFVDTLHHFPQTLELVNTVKKLYNLDLRVYKTLGANSRHEFAQRYGEALWELDVERFHYLTKIEPLQRAFAEQNPVAWITGRRRDQSSSRSQIPIFELDKHHRLKVNPLAKWTRKEICTYVAKYGVIYNPLYDQGYLSIGDEPLTTPVTPGEHERAGRWRGTHKTECGLHSSI